MAPWENAAGGISSTRAPWRAGDARRAVRRAGVDDDDLHRPVDPLGADGGEHRVEVRRPVAHGQRDRDDAHP